MENWYLKGPSGGPGASRMERMENWYLKGPSGGPIRGVVILVS